MINVYLIIYYNISNCKLNKIIYLFLVNVSDTRNIEKYILNLTPFFFVLGIYSIISLFV